MKPHVRSKRILFVLKDRVYQKEYSQSYGLYNSALMVAEYLKSTGNECKLVTVIDANFIDAEVYKYKPDIVIIEALWVTGKKLRELVSISRYKNIKWVIRVHSNIGFLAVESYAFRYINSYLEINNRNIIISFNNTDFNKNMSDIYRHNFKYLPNIVSIVPPHKDTLGKHNHTILNIGCFGAPRILKNQLFQAMCAIEVANRLGISLHFHINGDIQNPHNSVLSNMIELFKKSGRHKLLIHGWMEHDIFNNIIRRMDIGLQTSYTESFNIIVADFILNDVPIIVSDSITWMPKISKVSNIDYDELINKIIRVYKCNTIRNVLLRRSVRNLAKFNLESKKVWHKFIKEDLQNF